MSKIESISIYEKRKSMDSKTISCCNCTNLFPYSWEESKSDTQIGKISNLVNVVNYTETEYEIILELLCPYCTHRNFVNISK